MSDLDSCVETDGAPIARSQDSLYQRFKDMSLDSESDRVESGLGNSLYSQEGEELRKKITAPLQSVPEATRIIESAPRRETSPKDETHLCSTDEGYNSHSITDNDENRLRSLGTVCSDTETEALGRVAFCQDEDGDTNLHVAIIQLMWDVALNCICAAPSPNHLNLVNNLLQTPLHLAVLTRQNSVVRKLMTAGAQVDVRDTHGNTPLHIACREGFTDIVHTLLQPVNYEEIRDNSYQIPFQLIPQDLEAKNYEGLTCLHLAALGPHLKVMDLLLERGANINAQDGKSGRTVLHYAAEMGNRDLLIYLLRHPNTNIECLTYGGMTPIALAHGRNHQNIVAELVNYGADYGSIEDTEESDDDMNSEEMPYDDLCISGRPVW